MNKDQKYQTSNIQAGSAQPIGVSTGFDNSNSLENNPTTVSTGVIRERQPEHQLSAYEVSHQHRQRIIRFTLIGILLLLGGSFLLIKSHSSKSASHVSSSVAQQYGSINLPLGSIKNDQASGISTTGTVSVNGRLNINNSLVLAPTVQPSAAVAGQLYFDTKTNHIAYFDGSGFQTVATSNTVVSSIGGSTGAINLGNGLGIVGGKLSYTGNAAPTSVVTSLQGQSGNVSFSGGAGISVDGTALSNTGVLSLGGSNGAIRLGNGLTIAGGALSSTAVTGVSAGSNITVTSDGSGGVIVSGTGVSGTVSTAGGTVGKLAYFSGTQTLADSLISQNGTAVTVAGDLHVTGTVTLDNPLALSNGGTGSATPSGARSNIGAAALGANADITALMGLTTALSVGQGGTGLNSLSANGLLYADSTNSIGQISSSGSGLCLLSGAAGTAPSFQTCTGAGGVVSVNGQRGTITLDGAPNQIAVTTVGGTITLSTPQDLGTSSSVTFGSITASTLSGNGSGITNVNAAQLGGQTGSYYTNATNIVSGTLADTRLSTNVTLQGNTFNGASQLVQLNSSGNLTALNGSLLTNLNGSNISTGTIGDGRLSGNVALYNNTISNFTGSLQQNGSAVCTMVGNCTGVVGGAIGGSGTANKVAIFTGTGYSIGDSILSQDGGATTVSINGAVSVTGIITAAGFSGDGSNVNNVNATKLNGQTGTYYTNATNISAGTLADTRLSTNVTLQGNSFNGPGQLIQTTTGSGYLPALNASLLTNINASALTTGTVTDGRLSGNVSLYNNTTSNFTGSLQQNGNAVCTTAGNCNGAGGTITGGGTANKIPLFTGTGYSLGDSLLSQDSPATTVTIAGSLSVIGGVTATSFSGDGTNVTNVNAAQLGSQSPSFYTNAANISSGTLTNSRLSTSVTLQGNTFNGASQLVQLNNSGYLPALNGSLLTNLNGSSIMTGTVSDARLTTNVALYNNVTSNFTGSLQQNGNVVCTTAGNCNGVAGGAISGGGTVNKLAIFTGSGYSVGDSLLSQDGGATTVTINGAVSVSGAITANSFSGDGTNVTNVNAAKLNGQASSYYTNATNVSTGTLADARLSTNVTLQGNTFNGPGQLIQTNGSGYLPALNASLLTSINASALASGTVADARLTGNVSLYNNTTSNFTGSLQQNGNAVCTTVGNCTGVAGGAIGGSGTVNKIPVFTGTGYSIGNSLLSQDGGATAVSIAGNLSVSGDVTATSFSGNGSAVTNVNATQLNGQSASYYTNATNISSGTISDSRLSTNVTLQGNTFNGVGQLIQTNASGFLPALNASLLTSLSGTNITSGTVADVRLSTNVTLQGNTFNGASQLIQLNSSSQLPAVSGALVTNLNGTNVTTGTVANARLTGSGALSVNAGTGLTGGGNVALGGSTNLSVVYGAAAGNAVQGNVTLTCASGTGNLNGGGNTITLGSGGSCGSIAITTTPSFDTVTLGNGTGTTGQLVLRDGATAYSGTVKLGSNLSANQNYALPTTGGTICVLEAGNCTGSNGGGVTASGTHSANYLSKFDATGNSVTNSAIYNNATGVSVGGSSPTSLFNVGASNQFQVSSAGAVTSAGLNAGTGLIQGTGGLTIGGTTTLSSLSSAGGQCLTTDASGVLSLVSCLSGSGGGAGGVASLNGLSGTLSISNATAAGSTITINDAKADGATKGIAAFNSTNFSASSGVINTVQGIATTSTPTFAGLNLSTALSITNGGTGGTTASGARINLGAAASGANSDITALSGLTTALSIGQGGTGATTAAGARANIGAAANGANSDITSLNGLTTALSVGQGGTGLNALVANQLLFAGSTSSVSQLSNGGSGQCLVSNGSGSAPSFQTCTGAGGVSSINSQTGALTLNGTANQVNVTNSGSTFTFATPQDIGTTAAVTFGTLNASTLIKTNGTTRIDASGNLSNIGTISTSGLVTAGNGLTVSTGTITFNNLTGGASTCLTLNASNQVATSSCATGSGSNPTLQNTYDNSGATPVINLSTTGKGMFIQDASTPVGGNLFAVRNSSGTTSYFAVTTAGASVTGTFSATSLSGDGTNVTNVNATQLNSQSASYYLNASNSNAGTLADARLSGNVTLQGNTFNGANQLVKLDASGYLPALNGSALTNVNAALLNGQAASYYLNASNISSGTLADGRLSANVAKYNDTTANFTGALKQNGNAVCTVAGNCNGVAGGAISGGGTANKIPVFTGTGYSVGDSLLSQDGGATTVTIAGNLSVSGSVSAASLSGNGAGVTNVNAAQLGGQAGSYYTNATNISSGTLNDGRLSTNVALLGSNNNFTGTTLQHNGNSVCDASNNCNYLTGSAANGAYVQFAPASVQANSSSNDPIYINNTGTATNFLTLQQNGTTKVTISSTGAVTAASFSGNGSNLTNVNAALLGGQAGSYYTNASNISTGTLSNARLSTSVTLQGNTFNGASQLVQLDTSGYLPALNGSALTNLNATNLASGTVNDARLSSNVALLSANNNFTGTTLQHNGNSICDSSNNCSYLTGSAANGAYVQLAPASAQVNGTANGAIFINSTGTATKLIDLQTSGTDRLVVTSSGAVSATSFSGDGSSLTNLNASNVTSGTLSDGRLSTNITKQGNAFNGVSQLVQTDGSGYLPALNGSALTSLNASNLSTGTVSDSRLSTNVTLLNGNNNFTGATLQHNGNTVCDISNNCNYLTGSAANGSYVQFAPASAQSNATANDSIFVNNTGTATNFLTLQKSGTTKVSISSNGIVTAVSFSGDGSAVTNVNAAQLNGQAASYYTNATNVSTGTLADARLSTNVTLQGNTFNGANQLLKLNGSGFLPALNASLLTSINGSSIASGTVGVTYGGTGINGATAVNGQILIGNGSGYSLATITPGSGVSITNGAGSISIGVDSTVCRTTNNCVATGSAGGDLTGSYPNPTIAKLQGTTVTANTGLATGQVLYYNGTAWVNSGNPTLSSGLTVGNTTSNASLTVNGTELIKPTSGNDTVTAFQIQNSGGTPVLSADTTNNRIVIGTIGAPSSQLYVSGTVPTYLGTNSDNNISNPQNIAVVNNYAYVVSQNNNKLDAYDISNGTPVYVGQNSDSTLNGPIGIVVAGRYAYVAGGSKLAVYDISNIVPTLVGQNSDNNTSYAANLSVSGRYAYVSSTGNNKITVYDITSGTPVYVGQNSDSNLNKPLTQIIRGNYLYVASANSSRIVVYNIASGIPVYVGQNSDSNINGAQAIAISSHYIFVADYYGQRIDSYDIASGLPVYVGSNSDTNVGGYPQSITVQGNYAYITGGGASKLITYNISSGIPVYVGYNNDSGNIQAPNYTAVNGRYAFVASTSNNKLVAYDLGGAYIQQLQTGTLKTTNVNVDGNSQIGGSESIQGSLNVGLGLQVSGSISSSGSLNITSTGISSIFGKLGIGTTTPNQALSVVGNIAASGTITGGVGSPDYAENITTSDLSIAAADVVAMDPTHPGQVIKATAPYASSVMGVISTHPGFLTNASSLDTASDSDQRPLALSGRVPVKVSTENGAVRQGDYLTSSDVPGVAMKATGSGAVIGVAMGSFDGTEAGDTACDNGFNCGTVLLFISPSATNPSGDTGVMQGGDAVLTSLALTGALNASNINVGGLANIAELKVTGDATIGGDLTVVGTTHVAGIVLAGHLLSEAGSPTIASGSAAGSDGQASLDGTDTAGTITVTVMAHQPTQQEKANGVQTEVLSKGDLVNVTFSKQYEDTPRVVISADNEDTIGLPVYVIKTKTGYRLVLTQAAQTGKTYQFDYVIIGSASATAGHN